MQQDMVSVHEFSFRIGSDDFIMVIILGTFNGMGTNKRPDISFPDDCADQWRP